MPRPASAPNQWEVASVALPTKPVGPFPLGRVPADAGRVGHHVLHLEAGAVPRIHGQEPRLRQFEAHLIGVVRSDAGRADLLEEQGLQIRELAEGPGKVEDGVAGADPGAFRVHDLDVEGGPARGRHGLHPFHHQARRADDGAAQENGVGHARVAEALHDGAGAVEIRVRPRRDLGVGSPALRLPRHGYCAACAGWAAPPAGGARRVFSSSASRKASSRDCSALRRGSQKV